MIRIGVDVGGTRTRIAAVDAAGRILSRCSTATSDLINGPDPLGGLIAHLTEFLDKAAAIGLALPATLDERRSLIVRCLNVPALEGTRPADEIARRAGISCNLATDMEAAAWAEYVQRQPRPRRFVHLRIGTGVGVGVVIEGKGLRLDAGRTTHLPDLVVQDGPEARSCPCGLRGCLERYCSGAMLNGEIQASGIGLELADLQAAFDSGDVAARSIVESSVGALVKAIWRLTAHFRPQVVNLGGGVITRLPALLELTRNHINNNRSSGASDHATDSQVASGQLNRSGCGALAEAAEPLIESASLGDDAGVIGAADLATRREFSSRPDDRGVRECPPEDLRSPPPC